MWTTAEKGEISDLVELRISEKIICELKEQEIDLKLPGNVQKYAELALK